MPLFSSSQSEGIFIGAGIADTANKRSTLLLFLSCLLRGLDSYRDGASNFIASPRASARWNGNATDLKSVFLEHE